MVYALSSRRSAQLGLDSGMLGCLTNELRQQVAKVTIRELTNEVEMSIHRLSFSYDSFPVWLRLSAETALIAITISGNITAVLVYSLWTQEKIFVRTVSTTYENKSCIPYNEHEIYDVEDSTLDPTSHAEI